MIYETKAKSICTAVQHIVHNAENQRRDRNLHRRISRGERRHRAEAAITRRLKIVGDEAAGLPTGMFRKWNLTGSSAAYYAYRHSVAQRQRMKDERRNPLAAAA